MGALVVTSRVTVTISCIIIIIIIMKGTTRSNDEFGAFAVEPRSAFHRRGDTVVLRCSPKVGYTVTHWLHNGRSLAPRRRDHLVTATGERLVIRSFAHHDNGAGDEGDYQCVASGPQGAVVSRPARLLTAREC